MVKSRRPWGWSSGPVTVWAEGMQGLGSGGGENIVVLQLFERNKLLQVEHFGVGKF